MARKLMLKNDPSFSSYLERAYCIEKKTMAKIAEEMNCSPATVLVHLRRLGIQTRKLTDYPTTENQRAAWVAIGKKSSGRKLNEEQKMRISKANKGKRASDDYEFGGHEKTRKDGYVAVYCPDHPYASNSGYVMKHRLVVERELGIYIPENYVVHHINHDKSDNRIENLALMTKSAHASLHMIERKRCS